ncbi:hypothetical protein ACH4FX_11345 [Streptomyces sp. NPDC018019]|uniref:hypothetical protein n=1 Tax=Streptomyces sp. NPDC018019 TaxID=3365030 RepID=UPI00379C5163
MTTNTTQTPAADNETEPAPASLSLIDLYLLADNIVEKLGDGWSKDDDTSDNSDPETIHFAHQDGRAFGIRRLWNGSAAQTFARDPKTPGPRYNAACHFTTTEAPLDTLLDTLLLRLFPVFQGHRAKLRYDRTRIPAPAPTETTPQQTDQPDTPATSEPAAKDAPAKKTAAKKAAPAKTTPKKPTTASKTKPAPKRPAKRAPAATRTKTTTTAQAKRKTKPKAVPAAA